MAKKYIVTETELRDLLSAAHTMWALEEGGVDNWHYYCDSIHEYINNYHPDYHYIEDIVDKEIAEGTYQELT